MQVLTRVSSFDTLRNICASSRSYNEICKKEKSKIIAHVIFNKHGKNAFGGLSEWNAKYIGDIGIVKRLLQLGADIHAKDDNVLQYSAENGQLEMVKYLVEKGADIHARDD